MANIPTTGNGSALAAQNRDNIAVGTNGGATSLISWAAALGIPNSRLMMSEIGVPCSSNPLVDPNYDPGFTLTLQQMYLEFNPRNMHVTHWAGGRWREGLENFINVDGSGSAAINYRTTASSVLLGNLTGMNGVTAYRGFNLSGAEFSDAGSGGGLYSGTYGQQWLYPQLIDFQNLQSVGVTFIRFPIRQERLQPSVLGALDSAELTRLQNVLTWAHQCGIGVYIDPHQYGGIDFGAASNTGFNNNTVVKLGAAAPATQNGTAVPSGTTVEDCMNDFMIKLVNATLSYPGLVGWGMGNEPNGLPNAVTDWAHYLNRTVENIRAIDTSHIIFVGGYFFQGFANWTGNNGSGNLLTATIPTGQPGAGQIRGTGDANLIYDGHMYFDATGQYSGTGSSFSSLNSSAISSGYAAYNNNQPPPALDITSQSGFVQTFQSYFAQTSDFGGTYDKITAGTNTVTIPYTAVGDPSSTLQVICSTTSDEGGVQKSMTGTAVYTLFYIDLMLPTGTAAFTGSNFCVVHHWEQDNATDLAEIRIQGTASGYNVGLTIPSGSYTFNNTLGTVLNYGTFYRLYFVLSGTTVNLYINSSTTAEATLTGAWAAGTTMGGFFVGKYYGTIPATLYFGNVQCGNSSTYDAPPNGGKITAASTPAASSPHFRNGLLGFLLQ